MFFIYIESSIYHNYGAFHEDTLSSQLLVLITNMLVALVQEKISKIWSV